MYLHSIELKLAMLDPEYAEYRRRDSLVALQDCKENMLVNGKLAAGDVPEVVVLAGSFHEFYEGALGAYSTHTLFGPNTDEGIQNIAKIAELIGWTALSAQLKHTEVTLKTYPKSVVDDYLGLYATTEEIDEQLGELLCYDFSPLVAQDIEDGHKMRRRAHDWAKSQLDPSRCDDDQAVPLLPGTIEQARNRLGLEMQMPSLVEWRKTLAVWQASRSRPAN